MILKIFNGQSKTIFSAAVIIGAASLISRLLGLLRDRILASQFGAGDVLDVYYAAFRAPDMIFNLLVLGALSAGFIPIFSKYFFAIRKKEDAWRIANNILNSLVIVLVVLSVVIFIFAPWIVSWIVPGFDVAKQMETVLLTRIMVLSPIILGISSVFGGILQSLKRFLIYSLAPIFYNVGIIIGAVWFVEWWGIVGLAWGVILGACLHFALQLVGVIANGFKYKLILDWRDKDFREVVTLMIPRIFSLGISQVNLVVITIIASTLVAGSLTIFNFANNLQYVPIGIIGISFAIAAFPTLSGHAERGEIKFFRHAFSSTVRQVLFFMIPASIIFLVLRAQIVRVALGAGEFGWVATVATADTLAFFTFSFFAQAIIPLLVRMFFAMHNTITPLLTGLLSAAINIVAGLYLSKIYGVVGLAMAFSLASLVNFALLWVVLRIKIGSLDEYKIVRSLYLMSIAGIFMGIVVQVMKPVVTSFVELETFFAVFVQGLVAGIAGLVVYGAILWALKSPEMISFTKSVRKRFIKKYKPSESVEEATKF